MPRSSKLKKIWNSDWPIPFILSLFASLFTYFLVRSLRMDEIWRGPGDYEHAIRLSEDPVGYYSMMVFFFLMASIFWGGVIRITYALIRPKKS